MIKNALIAMVMFVGLTGCASGGFNQDALSAVKIPFQLYTDVYQPLLIEYGKLPNCTEPKTLPICRDYDLFVKMVDVDGKAVVAMQVANVAIASGAGEGDVLSKASTAVQEAMVLLAPLVAKGGAK